MCNELKKCILHFFLVLVYYSVYIGVRGERNFENEFETALEFHRKLHDKFLTSRHFGFDLLRPTTITPQLKKSNKKPIILNKFYKTFAAILRSLDDHDLMTVVQAADDEIREGEEENKPLLKSHFAKDPFIMELIPPTAIRNLDLDTPEYFSFVQDVNEYYKKRFATQKELKQLYRNITNIFVREMERQFDDKENSKKGERHLDAGVQKKLVDIVRNAVSIFKTHPSINNKTRDQIHLTLKTLWDDLRENVKDVERDKYTEKASKSPKSPHQVIFRYSLGDLLNLVNFMLESEIWQRSVIANGEKLKKVPKKFKEPLAAQFLQFNSIEVTTDPPPADNTARRMKKRIEYKALRADNEHLLAAILSTDNSTVRANTSTPLFNTSTTVTSTPLSNVSSGMKPIERRATKWIEWKYVRTKPHSLQLLWENRAKIAVVGDDDWKRKSRMRSQTRSIKPDAGFKVPFPITSRSIQKVSEETPKSLEDLRKHREKQTNITEIAKYLSKTLPQLIDEPFGHSHIKIKNNNGKSHNERSKHFNEIATYLSETLPKLIEEEKEFKTTNHKDTKKNKHNKAKNVSAIEEYISETLPKLIAKPSKRGKMSVHKHKKKPNNITHNRNKQINRKRIKKQPQKYSKIKIKMPSKIVKGFRNKNPNRKQKNKSNKRGKHKKQHKYKRKHTKITTRKAGLKMRKRTKPRTQPRMTLEYFLSANTSTTRMQSNQSSLPNKRKKTPRKLRYFSFNKTGKYRAHEDEGSAEGLAIEVNRSRGFETPDPSKTIWHKAIIYSDSDSNGISIEVNEPVPTSTITETTAAQVKNNVSTIPVKTVTINNQTKKNTTHHKTTKIMKRKRKHKKTHTSRTLKVERKNSDEDDYDGMSIEVSNVTMVPKSTNSSTKKETVSVQSSIKTTKQLDKSKTHVTSTQQTTRKPKEKHSHTKAVLHKILSNSNYLRNKHHKDTKHEGMSIEMLKVFSIPFKSKNANESPKVLIKQSNVTTTKNDTIAISITKATKTIKNNKMSRNSSLDHVTWHEIFKNNSKSRRNENNTLFTGVASEATTDSKVKHINNTANLTNFYQDFIELINKIQKIKVADEVAKVATLHLTTTSTPSTTPLINILKSLLNNSNQVVDIVMKTNNQTAYNNTNNTTDLNVIQNFNEVNLKTVRRADNSTFDINSTESSVYYYTETYYVYDSDELETSLSNTANQTVSSETVTTMRSNITTYPVSHKSSDIVDGY